MTVKPIILSHKRAGRVSTHRHVSGCVICVPEGQADEYAAAHPDIDLLIHPDSVVGIWAKREWIRVNAGGDHVQLDDDGTGFFRLYRKQGRAWKKAVLGPDRAYELLQETAERARGIGAFMFGWAQHAHPQTYNGLNPFRFGGYTPGAAFGLLAGWKGWWPDVQLGDGDDYWSCLINYHHHRYAFFDRRFVMNTWAGVSASSRTSTDEGGLEEFRQDKELVEAEVLAYLQQHFGADVIIRPTDKQGVPGRRRIVLPYHT